VVSWAPGLLEAFYMQNEGMCFYDVKTEASNCNINHLAVYKKILILKAGYANQQELNDDEMELTLASFLHTRITITYWNLKYLLSVIQHQHHTRQKSSSVWWCLWTSIGSHHRIMCSKLLHKHQLHQQFMYCNLSHNCDQRTALYIYKNTTKQ